MPRRVAIKAAFAREALPLAKQGQREHLARRQGGGGTTAVLRGEVRLAKVINHHGQRGQEGIAVNHGQTLLQVSSSVSHGVVVPSFQGLYSRFTPSVCTEIHMPQ